MRRRADQRNPKNILPDTDLVEMGSWGRKKKAFFGWDDFFGWVMGERKMRRIKLIWDINMATERDSRLKRRKTTKNSVIERDYREG